MACDVYYTMLFVDQGMGNLVTITDAGKTATEFSALIDFGTARSSAIQDTLDFLVKYVNANRAANPPKTPDFDLVVVSHQDGDHWNLFPTLMSIYNIKGAPLTVGTFAWGGNLANYKADAADAVAKLKAIAKTTLAIPITEQSAYAAAGALGPLAVYPATNPEIAFKPVMCNATVTAAVSSPDSMHLNTVSMMVGVIDVASSKCLFLLPGDATMKTVSSLKANESRAAELKGSLVLSVPHHGSHKSIADNYNAPAASRVFTYAQWFAGFVAPQTIGASAGFFARYKHPHMTVLQLFTGTVAKNMTTHGIVSYQTGANRYVQTSTKWGVFTNYVAMNSDGKSGTAKRIIYKYAGGTLTVTEHAPNAVPGPGLAL